MKVTGETKICGLIGYPVGHSVSPQMHNSAFKALKLNFIYVTFEVKEALLKAAVEGIKGLGIRGVNVTIPYKVSITNYLNELRGEASLIGAVNTILNEGGRLIGFNTDAVGALRALEAHAATPIDKKVVVLGAGGAARAIAFALAGKARSITIVNRTEDKALALANELRRELNANALGKPLTAPTLKDELKDADILINATPTGMVPNVDQTLVGKELLRSDMAVMDIVYNPLETLLLKEARKIGAKCIDGLEMLVQQGAESFRIWTGREPPVRVMRDAALKSLKKVPKIGENR